MHLLSILLLLFNFHIKPLEEVPPAAKMHYQLGVNASFFVERFLHLGGATSASNSDLYQLTHRFIFNKFSIRYSQALNYNNSKFQNLNQPIQTITTFSTLNKIGFEHTFLKLRRWSSAGGAELLLNYNLNKSSNTASGLGESIIKIATYSVGAGLYATINYQLTPKISLGTEAGLNFNKGATDNKQLFTSFPDQNSQSSTNNLFYNFNSPISLFFK